MGETQSYRFSKREKVCNVREISSLFKGRSLFAYPFKLAYIKRDNSSDEPPIKVLCSVGKRYSKSAVKRNLIKRRIREAYRLNKHILSSKIEIGSDSFSIGFIYIAQKEESYEQIEKSVVKLLKELSKAI